jgi:exosortase
VSTLAAPKPLRHAGAPGPAPARPGKGPPVPRWVTPEALVMAGVLGAAFLTLFFRWFYYQALHSWEKPADWGHAFVVPIISGYLIWQRRDELAATKPRTFWPALAPFLLGIVAYFFFVATRFTGGHMIQGWAVIATLGSLLLLMLGPRMFAPLFLPVAFLVFGVTISEQVMNRLTAPLQLIASQGAYVILSLVGAVSGFSVELDGTLITLVSGSGNTVPVNVAEACAGMRMVIAFFALAGATALLACRYWWQRIALLLLAAPVAILVNIGRVAVLGLLSLANPNLAAGQAHMFIGELLLIPGLLLFLLVVWVLRRAVREGPPGDTA